MAHPAGEQPGFPCHPGQILKPLSVHGIASQQVRRFAQTVFSDQGEGVARLIALRGLDPLHNPIVVSIGALIGDIHPEIGLVRHHKILISHQQKHNGHEQAENSRQSAKNGSSLLPEYSGARRRLLSRQRRAILLRLPAAGGCIPGVPARKQAVFLLQAPFQHGHDENIENHVLIKHQHADAGIRRHNDDGAHSQGNCRRQEQIKQRRCRLLPEPFFHKPGDHAPRRQQTGNHIQRPGKAIHKGPGLQDKILCDPAVGAQNQPGKPRRIDLSHLT